MAHHTGKVAWFNNAKGYGFLTSEDGSEVFCHFSSILTDGYKSLKQGEPVEYDVEQGAAGKPQAASVKRLILTESRKTSESVLTNVG